MYRFKFSIPLLALSLVFVASPLFAQTVVKATLDGGQEVPKIATAMYGDAVYVIAADKLSIDFRLTVQNNGTDVTNAHIHLGPEGLAGPVIVPLFSGRTQKLVKGSISGTLTSVDLVKMVDLGLNTFSDLIDNILRGNTYTNVHTTKYPAGEVRGLNKAVENR